jgi:hypothetical protein
VSLIDKPAEKANTRAMPKSKIRVKKKNSRKSNSPTITAVSVRRTRPTFEIELANIHVPEWMACADPIFSGLYEKYLSGRIPGFLTRVPIGMIKEGFYLPSEKFAYKCDVPPEDVILGKVRAIQQGARPPLHLYLNRNTNCNFRFLCPDDVASCLAYKQLRIGSVPAIVFGPGRESLPFSSLQTRVSTLAPKLGPRICGLVSAERPTKLATIIGKNLPDDPLEVVRKLLGALRTVIARLRLVHIAEKDQLHYHHMVFSALVRTQETLTAIELLIEKNLWYQALALLRVLYEIHLNYYFDWLQPETNYMFLAAAAVFGNAARQKQLMSEELVAQGVSATSATEQANIAWRPVAYAATVSEKARLPKVGILYHKEIYEFLSRVSHQDFEVASLHANRFDDDTFKSIAENVKLTYLRFMDYVVSEFVTCVNSDIGSPLTKGTYP